MIKRFCRIVCLIWACRSKLFIAALPLISIGAAGPSRGLFWLGFVSMGVAAAIPQCAAAVSASVLSGRPGR